MLGLFRGDRNQVNCHRQSDQCQEQGYHDGRGRRARVCGVASIQLPYQPGMMPCRMQIQDHPGRDKRGSKPKRESMNRCGGIVLEKLGLQKEAKPRHDKAESHQGKTGANPCKKRSLSSKIIAEVRPLLYFQGSPLSYLFQEFVETIIGIVDAFFHAALYHAVAIRN